MNMADAPCGQGNITAMVPLSRAVDLRHVFLSILLFGVASLFLFMHLQDCVETHHRGELVSVKKGNLSLLIKTVSGYEFQQQFAFQDSLLPGKKSVDLKNKSITYLKGKTFVHQQSGSKIPILKDETKSLKKRLQEQKKAHILMLKQFVDHRNFSATLRPLNKSLIKVEKWKETDRTQEQRRSFLQDFCKKYNHHLRRVNLIRMVSRIYVEDKYHVLYCEVPKAGCSNWKRALMVLGGFASSTNNISHDAVHYGKYLRRLDSYDIKGIYERLDTYTKVIFVRDPMERLVSAFRFEHPNSYYHPVFGTAIIKRYRDNATVEALKTGSGVTFQEITHYLLDPQRPVGMDIHWEQVNRLCNPCLVKYDFIGKFETMEEDANYFLRLIGAPEELNFPSFKDRHSSEERTTSAIVMQYLQKLSSPERKQTCDFYYLDYLMFNYTRPHV